MGVEECVEVAEVIGTKMVPAWFILKHTDSPPAKFTVTGLAWLHSSGVLARLNACVAPESTSAKAWLSPCRVL